MTRLRAAHGHADLSSLSEAGYWRRQGDLNRAHDLEQKAKNEDKHAEDLRHRAEKSQHAPER